MYHRSSLGSQLGLSNRYADWSEVASKREKYPHGIRKSDLRNLPGTGEWAGRRRCRTQTGSTNRKQVLPSTAAPILDIEADTRKRAAAADTDQYYKRSAKIREKGTKPNRLAFSSSDCENKQPADVYQDLVDRTLPSILDKSFAASDTTQTNRDVSLIRSLNIPKPVISTIAHLDHGIQTGIVLQSRKPTQPRATKAVRPRGEEAAAAAAEPVFPDAIIGKTRLGATRYPVTNQMVEMDPKSSGYAPASTRYETKSRGLDLTWQKESKILSQASTITKLRKRAAHEDRIRQVCAENDVRVNELQDRRAAARSVQQQQYAAQVEILERHRSGAR
eukprot:TRINITY_DN7289_c0_g1_i1.p1 TRINITY_DN7289_c0_g1~~TRINITY_DN7289_c0_g1_i1.p1  ORF type:complete len:333 (+),score=39.88 TRINITY_DN7289_c0_g1_i1:536-1534(+)